MPASVGQFLNLEMKIKGRLYTENEFSHIVTTQMSTMAAYPNLLSVAP